MNLRILLTILLSVVLSINAYSQGATCANAEPACTDAGFTFPNSTGVADASDQEPANNYDCLGSSPNPAWFFMEIANGGAMDIEIEQTDAGGLGLDVDFILYGPYTSLANAQSECGNLGTNSASDYNFVVDCSYSGAAIETANITNAQTGEVYVMLITNFSGNAGEISFNQTGGSASTNCNVLNPCSADAGQDTEMCIGSSYTLGGSPAVSSGNGSFTHAWSPKTGLNDSTLLNPIATPSQTTTYYLTMIDDSSCTSTDSVIVTVHDYPVADAGADDTLKCIVSQLALDGSLSLADNYSWTTADGNILSGSGTQTPSVNAPGTYVLTTTNGGICMDYDTVIVYKDVDNPLAEAGIGGVLNCITDSLILDGAGSSVGSNYTYMWTGGSIVSNGTTLSPTVNSAATYTITVTDNINGCESTDDVVVTSDLTPPSVSINPQGDLCPGENVSLSASTSGHIYGWTTTGGNIVSGDSTLSPMVGEGDYLITSTDTNNGCISNANIQISETQISSIISASPSEGIAPLDVGLTNVGIADNSVWLLPGDSIVNTTSTNYIFEQGSYQIGLVSIVGVCVDTTWITIVVAGVSDIMVPNVFTPGNNGFNDEFKVQTQNMASLNCVIFNRWGKKVVEFDNVDGVWDGKVNGGGDAADGTYFYIIKAVGDDDKEFDLKGTVSLIRDK